MRKSGRAGNSGLRCGVTDLDGLGFLLADIELSDDQCDYIATSLPSVVDQRGGGRGLLSHPTVLQLIRHRQLAQFLWALTGRELVAVAARLLDCGSTSETSTQWHQDRRVAVRERLDVQGYGPWTTRIGISQVEPPSSVLDQMVVVQVHLDHSATENHVLRLFPGSHRGGKLTADAISHLVETQAPVIRAIPKGSLVAMRPLLVHASSAAPTRLPHYRVLHIGFAPPEAITPLQWHATVQLHRAA